MRELEWPRADEMKKLIDGKTYEKLMYGPQVFGETVAVDRLRYARIFEAGHMAQEKKGPQVRDMVYSFIGIGV